MKFEIHSSLNPGVFYSQRLQGKDGYYFLPFRILPETEELFVKDFDGAAHLTTNFSMGIVGFGGYVSSFEDAAGFLFHSKLPVLNYGTAVLSYSRAWQKSSPSVSVTPSETTLVLKTTQFYVYHVAAIATLITCPDLSDNLSSYLTMI